MKFVAPVKSLVLALLVSLPAFGAEAEARAEPPGIFTPKHVSVSTAYVSTLGKMILGKQLHPGLGQGMGVSALISLHGNQERTPAWMVERASMSFGLNAITWPQQGEASAYSLTFPIEFKLDLLTGRVRPFVGMEYRLGWLAPPPSLSETGLFVLFMEPIGGVEVLATDRLRVGAHAGIGYFVSGGIGFMYELGLGLTFLL